ncbi:MAG: tetratricopeptide repeat protein [Acidobacteriota bacterium]
MEGDYELVVEAEGYQTHRENLSFSFPDRTKVHLNIYLREASPRDEEGVSPQALKWYDQGVKAAAKGKSKKAIQLYRKAVDREPEFLPGLHNLGAEYVKIGDFRKSVEVLEKAVRLKTSNGGTYHVLGLAYYHLKEWSQAARDFQIAIEKQDAQTSGASHFYLGHALLQLKQPREAAEHLLRSLQIEEKSFSRAHLSLAFIYLDYSNQPQKALGHLEAFLKLNPKDERAPRIRQKIEQLKARSGPR